MAKKLAEFGTGRIALQDRCQSDIFLEALLEGVNQVGRTRLKLFAFRIIVETSCAAKDKGDSGGSWNIVLFIKFFSEVSWRFSSCFNLTNL